jgi:hypothetical protein
MVFTPRSQRTQSQLKPIDPDLFLTEDREERLVFLLSKQKQSLLGNLVRADTSRFASLCDLCVKMFGKAGYITPGEGKIIHFPTSRRRGFPPPLAGCSTRLKS